MPVRQIIVHGDCWPVTTAVAHLVRSVLSTCEYVITYTLPVLLQQLHRKPEATQTEYCAAHEVTNNPFTQRLRQSVRPRIAVSPAPATESGSRMATEIIY